jgi:exopolyphosphatase/guanosine-5'-triphosphate,3'-diphosphate pyrophosphatase
VTRLALALFDALAPAHGLGEEERFLLQCGAMLHDIGWTDGRKGHHKTAQRLIGEARRLPLDERERRLVALVARYHRKALPSPSHEAYAALDEADRRRVDVLGGILRVADGLDRSHLSVVQGVACEVTPAEVRIRCRADGPAATEISKATQKGDLLQQALARTLVIERAPPPGA